ncbi:acyl-homoserine-lactone synthase [Palleronia rufa]|uniref:acyl-homoserine-lactone synthase n=1 Tax=Palleronia rufa TaxID=1530186 RepID=UPI0005604C11|nr:acyl-homoserine-lactone synthase [Palleronia rufa]
MKTTTLSFHNMHEYGPLLANVLRARYETFIEEAKWDIPSSEGMEYDQYDTPASRWIVVHDADTVLAGVRLTPTTARCGIYTYMIRDAQKGLLDSISSDLLYEEAPVSPDIIESSRIFVSSKVEAKLRMRVQIGLISEMVASAERMNAKRVLGLIPANGARWGRRVGLDIEPAGPVLEFEDGTTPSRCVWINLNASH